MAKVIQRRRGSTIDHSAFTGALAELTVDTTKKTVVVHDGVTVGGNPLLRQDLSNISTTPLLVINGENVEADDLFLVYDVSVGVMKKITRAELNNAIERDALSNVSITGGTITGITDLAIADGGTGASTAGAAITNLGATTVGGSIFTLVNPSAISFLRLNANNTVSALSASDFRTAIGASASVGPLLPAAGTASAPAYSTSGDANTGIFFPAADTIGFAEGGVEAMRIGSTGTITLGAAPGAESLRVTPITNAVNYLEVTGGATGNGVTLSAQGANSNINIILTPKGTSAVGIGTATPSAKLSLQQTGLSANTAMFNSVSEHSNASVAFFDLDLYTVNTQAGGSTMLRFRKARGTLASPALVVADSVSGRLGSQIHDGATFYDNALINFSADGTPALNSTPGRIQIYTTPSGSTTVSERMRIAANGVISLGAAPGSESLRVTPVASAVNYLQITGGTAGNGVTLSAVGSDTNIGIILAPKGNIGVFSPAYNFTQYTSMYKDVSDTIFWSISNSAVNNLMKLAANGNFDITNNFAVVATTSAVNYLEAKGGATGSNATLSAKGSDTNVGMIFAGKGTGNTFFNNNGANQLVIGATASAVNYLEVIGAAEYDSVALFAQGSDSNINFSLNTKNFGSTVFYGNSNVQFEVAASVEPSTVNWLQVTGSATNSGPVLAAVGSDTNIDLNLTPKGSGTLKVFSTAKTTSVSRTLLVQDDSAIDGQPAIGFNAANVDTAGDSVSAIFKFYGLNNRFEFRNATDTAYVDAHAGTFVNASDYRLKENVQPSDVGLQAVLALSPVKFNWKSDNKGVIGFIAHQAQEVVPEAVTGEKDGVNPISGAPDFQGIKDSVMIAVLVKAIQEQQALITNLTARLATLESK